MNGKILKDPIQRSKQQLCLYTDCVRMLGVVNASVFYGSWGLKISWILEEHVHWKANKVAWYIITFIVTVWIFFVFPSLPSFRLFRCHDSFTNVYVAAVKRLSVLPYDVGFRTAYSLSSALGIQCFLTFKVVFEMLSCFNLSSI